MRARPQTEASPEAVLASLRAEALLEPVQVAPLPQEPLQPVYHRWDKRRTIAVTAIAVHRTIARSIVTRLRYRWLYFRYSR